MDSTASAPEDALSAAADAALVTRDSVRAEEMLSSSSALEMALPLVYHSGALLHSLPQSKAVRPASRASMNEKERKELDTITEALENEFTVSDSLQEEMLRILLKRFIIQCTRIARHRMNITREKESGFEIVRQYYNLVDEHYRTKKQVQDYADMLHKSPKTLSNIFSTCKLPSPLRVIHERVEAEAKRLLLYSNKSAKEIADILGFEDQASFSRFFKNMTGQSAVQFRNTQEGKN